MPPIVLPSSHSGRMKTSWPVTTPSMPMMLSIMFPDRIMLAPVFPEALSIRFFVSWHNVQCFLIMMAFNKIEVQNGALGNGLVQFELISLNSGLVMRFQELNPRHSSSMMSMCIPLRALLLQWLLPLVLGESIPFLHSILTINWASLTMRTIMTMTLGLFRMACQKTM